MRWGCRKSVRRRCLDGGRLRLVLRHCKMVRWMEPIRKPFAMEYFWKIVIGIRKWNGSNAKLFRRTENNSVFLDIKSAYVTFTETESYICLFTSCSVCVFPFRYLLLPPDRSNGAGPERLIIIVLCRRVCGDKWMWSKLMNVWNENGPNQAARGWWAR